MADLLDWFGGQVEGAFAELNPFDNGANYQSVMDRRRREEEKARRVQTTQPGPAQQSRGPVNVVSDSTAPSPALQSAPSTASISRNSVVNKTLPNTAQSYNKLDVYNQRQQVADLESVANRRDFNSADEVRQTQEAQRKLADIQEYGKNKEGNLLTFAQDFVGGFVQPGAQIVNSIADTSLQHERGQKLTDLYNKGAINKVEFYNAANNILENSIDRRIEMDKNGNIVGRQANPLEFAGKFIREGADAGVTYSPVGAGYGMVAKQGLKSAVPGLLKEGAAYSVADTANDFVQGRPITPESIAMNTLMAFGGAGLGAGGAWVQPKIRPAVSETAARMNPNNPINSGDPHVLEYNDALTRLRQKDARDAANGLSINSSVRKANRRAETQIIQRRDARIKRLNQGGFIQNPIGKDLNPEQKKLLRQEIEADIYQNNPELMMEMYSDGTNAPALSENGDPGFPTIHVDDLKHYLGNYEDFPKHLRRRTGPRNIDELAAHAGYDDIDQFIDQIYQNVQSKKNTQSTNSKLNEMKRDPELQQRVLKNIEDGKSSYVSPEDWAEASKSKSVKNLENRTMYNWPHDKAPTANQIEMMKEQGYRGIRTETGDTLRFEELSNQKVDAGVESSPGNTQSELGSTTARTELPQTESPRPVDQQSSNTSTSSNIVHHTLEDTASDINKMGIDAAIQAELKSPGADVPAIEERLMERTGMTRVDAEARVREIAQMSQLDIRDGKPTKINNPSKTPLDVMAGGPNTTAATLKELRNATDTLKANSMKGLKGRNNAVIVKESKFQRLYAFRDEKGEVNTFIMYRKPDGTWSKPYDNPAPIKSPDDFSKSMRLLDDAQMNEEVQRAVADGNTRQYIWTETDTGATQTLTSGKKDPVTPKALQFDPEKHYIAGGFVRDKADDQILGNYVSVGPNGIEVQIGRNFVTFDLDFSKLGDGKGGIKRIGQSEGGNNMFNQTERWIESVTRDEATRAKLREFLVYPTRDSEAAMKVEARAMGEGINEWEKAFKDVKRKRGSYQEMMRDSVYVIEPDTKQVKELGPEQAKEKAIRAFRDSYGDEAAKLIQRYDGWLRESYDNLLERMNAERRQFGMDEVAKRDDYITHTAELGGDLNQLYQSMREGVFGEVDGAARRDKLPAKIAALSDQFEPITKYNKFTQRRRADTKPQNPFDPLRQYSAVTLHNIHLTAPAARTRSLQQALRAADEYIGDLPNDLKSDDFKRLTQKLSGDHSDMVNWLAEHANILSGKTPEIDRVLMKYRGGRNALKTMRWAQRQAGHANILGNMSSVVSQTLNFPNVLGTNGAESTMKGVVRTLGDTAGNAPWRKSSLMVERYTDGSILGRNTALQKTFRAMGVPLKYVERAFYHVAWNASYEKALSRGLKGRDAIKAADTAVTKITPSRSIGDTAHVYNNTTTNAPLQFTREVTEAWKNFTKDQSPYGKALTLVAIMAMNEGIGALTGRKPLPDPLGATVDTVADFTTSDDSLADKTARAAQRGASTVVGGVPLLSSAANGFLGENEKKFLFGRDSDLGRYDGTMAMTNVLSNTLKAGGDALKGNWEGAGQDVVSMLPGGSQMRKTWQGGDALAQGYTEDSSGNVQTPVEPTLSNIAKGLLFGKNALDEQQQYYNENGRAMVENQTKAYKELRKTNPNAANQYADTIKSRRSISRGDTPSGNSDGIKNPSTVAEYTEDKKLRQEKFKASFSAEDYKLLNMSKSDRRKLIQSGLTTQKKLDGLDSYADQKRKEFGLNTTTTTKVSKNLKQEYRDTLSKYDSLTSEERDAWFAKENDAEYEYELAKYNNDLALGKLSTRDKIATKKSLAKQKIGSKYTSNMRDLYSLSKGDLYDYLTTEEKGVDKEKLANNLLAYDRALYDAGLVSYRKFKTGLAPSSGRGGSKSKGITIGKEMVSLNRLVNGIRAPKTATAPSAGNIGRIQMRRAPLRQYTVQPVKQPAIKVA